MGQIQDRISVLRREMKSKGLDLYLIPTADFHQSEYVGEHFKFRQYISGFTGSAGTVAVTKDRAVLWTDGRYTIQAEKELEGTEIEFFCEGTPNTETLLEFVENNLPLMGRLGADGRCIGARLGRKLNQIAEKKGGTFCHQEDLSDSVWGNRPERAKEPVYPLSLGQCGESRKDKLHRIREEMKKWSADGLFVASLDDIAWTLNLRGADVAYCPLFLSYLFLEESSALLFANAEQFSDEIRSQLQEDGIRLAPYDAVFETARGLSKGRTIVIDPERISYSLRKSIAQGVCVLEKQNPQVLMKSKKNETEIRNIRQAHLKDGIAHTRFLYWLKHHIGKETITELSASEQLLKFRMEQEGFLGASFAPISAYGEHGAIVHYSADEKSDCPIKEGNFLLMDTGGHYLEGSTDITRTIAIGEVDSQKKEDFTLVARAMLRLADTIFLHGCSGGNLDCMARSVLWKEHKNFNHGTGHGVGYLMNIHEPPIQFRWKGAGAFAQSLEKNMVITDEPGIYQRGSHGIRLENELLVSEDCENEYGQFLRFEILTLVPLDLDALLPEKMTAEERDIINRYHKQVYDAISPFLPSEERVWLRDATRAI